MILIRSLAALMMVAGASISTACGQEPTKVRFTLDWKLQGVHAWYFWAQEKGSFAAEKLDVTIDQGEGSAATVTRIMSGAYDAGFGDINALIHSAAAKPGEAPVMVYMIYNKAPFALLTKAASPITSFKDLAGKTLGILGYGRIGQCVARRARAFDMEQEIRATGSPHKKRHRLSLGR